MNHWVRLAITVRDTVEVHIILETTIDKEINPADVHWQKVEYEVQYIEVRDQVILNCLSARD
jgi:hypothetical protein